MSRHLASAAPATPAETGRVAPGWPRALLLADAAWRLGPRPVGLLLWHRMRVATGIAARALGAGDDPLSGPFLPRAAQPARAPGDAAALAAAADAATAGGWHGPFDAMAQAVALDLHGAGDIRPVWERHRLAALPWLAMAARLAPTDGHLAASEALLARWAAANPAFRGPAWACGQEAALRALHLALALALLDADRDPPPAMRALLALHARRIAATRAYAMAQDNNHAVSEPAGLFVLGLLLRDAMMSTRGARDLARAVTRLVAPDGAFAQASPAYHRLLLDTLALAEWFRRRHGAPPFAAPFAARAAAATRWLHRAADPATGALPRCGPCDDSALADLSLRGPFDARGSLARAARMFCDADVGGAADPGCAWLGLAPAGAVLTGDAAWRSEGWMGAARDGLRLLLRTGAPLRFRPGQEDILHLDLTADGVPLLADGGTGAYTPPPGRGSWTDALVGVAGHNTIQFDDHPQMPRAGRFLFARWPRCTALPDGAAMTDHRGCRHERRFDLGARRLAVRDRISGPFARAVLRWRLGPGPWRATADGAEGPRARIRLSADAPCAIRLAEGWESPAYGVVRPAPVLELVAAAPVGCLTTRVEVA
ncbi:heparinase II/III-family protein [Roseomonas sp. PWR1]|uniref:Heparinase II/III-family protein n=1 Tax=Roseomonas nitratireducens TaxID=2820810 RepID=A0ABS4ALS7_9PROT|nr:heparinase II/III-family protein [Neoroseomonas nitratireducens]MBP0462316.1 heparinase II/III-family protein [Neoroseomonas nitratireducens]